MFLLSGNINVAKLRRFCLPRFTEIQYFSVRVFGGLKSQTWASYACDSVRFYKPNDTNLTHTTPSCIGKWIKCLWIFQSVLERSKQLLGLSSTNNSCIFTSNVKSEMYSTAVCIASRFETLELTTKRISSSMECRAPWVEQQVWANRAMHTMLQYKALLRWINVMTVFWVGHETKTLCYNKQKTHRNFMNLLVSRCTRPMFLKRVSESLGRKICNVSALFSYLYN